MTRWSAPRNRLGLVLGLLLALFGVIWLSERQRALRLGEMAASVDRLVELFAMEEDPPEGEATAEVPCPRAGLTITVCAKQKAEESDEAFAARYLAKIEAFKAECEER